MKKQMIFAACLILTPYLAVAATEPVASTTPLVQDVDASNTGINKRDRDDKTLTPIDQMNNPADLKITQEIRQALMKGEFSMDAKNIKVITRDGNDLARSGQDHSRTGKNQCPGQTHARHQEHRQPIAS